MARRRLLLAVCGLSCLLIVPAVQARTPAPAPSWAPPPARYGQGSDLNVGVRMSDGTVLRADVFFPTAPGSKSEATGSFPVLLQQTPYGKEAFDFSTASPLTGSDIPYFVQRGFIVVISDVRGTGTSGGSFGLFDPVQISDGATMARWAAALPHSDGKVGLWGSSYMGIDQFLTVAGLARGGSNPVKAMFPVITGHDLLTDAVTQGGIPDAEFSAAYLALVTGLNAGSPLLEPLAQLGEGDTTPAIGSLATLAQTELAHNQDIGTYDLALLDGVELSQTDAFDGPYWAVRSPASYLSDVVSDHIPAFLVGGWNDLFQAGEPLNYVGLQNLYDGRPEAAPMSAGQTVTPRYQLLMGPWAHVTTGSGINLSAIQLEWFDTWLLGQDTPLAHTTTPLHLEDLHTGSWINSRDWPIASTSATPFYFGSGHTLTTAPPAAASGSDQVLWDGISSPCNMQSDQWSGGFVRLLFNDLNTKYPCEANDATLSLGPGAVTYTSAPFATAKELIGPIDATIKATATTTDTELVATVEEVSPTGQSVPLTSGALLGSRRQLSAAQTWMGSDGKPLLPIAINTQLASLPVVPGRVTTYNIEVFPTYAQIPAGWRLQVTITTGDTPHLVPTPDQATHLIGGVYQIERTSQAASYLNVPLASPAALSIPCGALCTPAGP